ncbi:MAG: TetR family transcriptional regulator [Spirochaetes bacterium]|jgi:AcrR family transcriptional regulator|nr:TetR family transcriptional regulator [Spirochaetota bacterium]
MPQEAFFGLDDGKQEQILAVAAQEFAAHGYQNASTNRIVKRLEISKGSLFYYFADKADLYLYLIERSTNAYMEALRAKMEEPPADILDRMYALTEAAFDFLSEDPYLFRLMMTFMDAATTELRERFMRENASDALQEFQTWFADIDTTHLAFDRETTLQLVTWLFAGIKIELLYWAELPTDEGEFRRRFMERLELVFAALRRAIYTQEEDEND